MISSPKTAIRDVTMVAVGMLKPTAAVLVLVGMGGITGCAVGRNDSQDASANMGSRVTEDIQAGIEKQIEDECSNVCYNPIDIIS